MKEYDVGIIEARTLMGEEGMVEYFEQVLRDDSDRNVKSVVSWYVQSCMPSMN